MTSVVYSLYIFSIRRRLRFLFLFSPVTYRHNEYHVFRPNGKYRFLNDPPPVNENFPRRRPPRIGFVSRVVGLLNDRVMLAVVLVEFRRGWGLVELPWRKRTLPIHDRDEIKNGFPRPTVVFAHQQDQTQSSSFSIKITLFFGNFSIKWEYSFFNLTFDCRTWTQMLPNNENKYICITHNYNIVYIIRICILYTSLYIMFFFFIY